MKQPIKITKAALADWGDKEIILRGVIDPSSLAALKVDSYQRGVQPPKYIRDIMKGFDAVGGVPDIELGMRGHSFTEAGGDFFLHDQVFIIDGLQRTTAAMEVLKNGVQPKLGVMIHLDTNVDWETKRFEVLNMNRAKVAPSVLIRNQAKDNAAVKMLHDLGYDSSFPLAMRIAWDQRMKRGQLVQGQVLLKTACQLHRRFGAGLTSSRHAELSRGLDKALSRIGRTQVRDNVRLFWEVLDEAFNVRGVEIASAAHYLKAGFLRVLAKLFSDHQDFWNDWQFTVSSDLRRKLGTFKINDPTISRLCGATGAAQTELYFHLVTHINSGKRTRRLRPFDVTEFVSPTEGDDEEMDDIAGDGLFATAAPSLPMRTRLVVTPPTPATAIVVNKPAPAPDMFFRSSPPRRSSVGKGTLVSTKHL